MAPGVEVARVDSNTWSLGVRGFESTLSRSVLVLIDGRSVYTLCSQAFIGKSRTHCLRISTGSKSSEAPAVPSGERMPSTR